MLSILISILLILIIILLIWNFINRKSLSLKGLISEDEKYYELKYQSQFYVAVFSTFITVLVFFGFSSYEEVKEKIKNDLKNEYEEKIDSALKVTSSFKNEMLNNKKDISFIKEQNQNLTEIQNVLFSHSVEMLKDMKENQQIIYTQLNKSVKSEESLKKIENEIKEINKIDFLKQVYLVANLKYYLQEELSNQEIVYFKDLKTLNGNNLVQFKNKPTLLITSNEGNNFAIVEVTNEYFKIILNSSQGIREEKNKTKNYYYDLLIIYKEE